MAKTPQEVGKDFEEDFRLLCKDITTRRKAALHRLYDAHSVGTFLPEQPGDFMFLFEGNLHLFELKSSSVHTSLTGGLSDLLGLNQAAQLRFWDRAGAVTHILFLDQTNKTIELWAGAPVALVRQTYRGRLNPKGEGIVLRFKNFKAFGAFFETALIDNPRFSALGC